MKKKLIVMSLLISAFLMATDNEKGLTEQILANIRKVLK